MSYNYNYSATKLKRTTKKSKILTKAIDCKASLPFDQAWSRASKKVGPLQSIAQGPKKKNRFLPDFVWGFWPDFLKMRLGPKKIILLIRWPQSTHRSLTLKGLVKKFNRAFITDTTQISSFSSVPP